MNLFEEYNFNKELIFNDVDDLNRVDVFKIWTNSFTYKYKKY